MRNKGFTLIEVLIAITILAILMAFTSRSVSRSVKDKNRLQAEIDRDSQLTNAFRLIERDLSMAFHYRDINSEVEQEIKKKCDAGQCKKPKNNSNGGAASGSTDGQPGEKAADSTNGQATSGGNTGGTPIKLDFEPKQSENFTQFEGSDSSMSFSSLGNIRMYKDSPESHQMEVSYFLAPCRSFSTGEQVQCLWRRTTPYIDQDITKGGNPTLLLENIKDFKLRYFGEGKQDWVSSWKTGADDTATQSRFPQAVEITLAVEEMERVSRISGVVSVAFPNNPENKKIPDENRFPTE